ncbi:phosphoglycerate kinase [Candidatus Dojkabacteria bacterium]|nr:phosphoglycerate kinase [Candidatus Dojkabacteria bacterium]
MTLKSLSNIDVQNKTILYRAPYDIETKKDANGVYEVTDETRISATIPTLKYLLEKNCKIVILTWVKRPEGVDPTLTTEPHARCLTRLLEHNVEYIPESIGEKVKQKISEMQAGQILMLENVRFHKAEYEDNNELAMELVKGCDLIVFDAFPQAHRVHSSTTGILRNLQSVTGFYFEKEYTSLSKILKDPKRPFTALIGGAKVSDKIEAVKNLLKIADIILVGGGLANAFLKAQGKEMGASYIEDVYVDEAKGEKKDWVQYAKQILEESENYSVENFSIASDMKLSKILLPYDLIIGKDLKDDSITEVTKAYDNSNVVKPDFGAYDIGPETAKIYSEIISKSQTVFWAGPMGVFEKEGYANGTKQIVHAINNSSEDKLTIAAGGDSINALNDLGDPSKVSYVSLAGGATLDFLAGKEFPVLQYLEE